MWLKQWDSCVFGVEIKSTTDDVLSSLKRHSSVIQHPRRSSRSSFGNTREPSIDNERAHNDLHTENNDSNGIKDLWDKKHRQGGPPEQKVSQTGSFPLCSIGDSDPQGPQPYGWSCMALTTRLSLPCQSYSLFEMTLSWCALLLALI